MDKWMHSGIFIVPPSRSAMITSNWSRHIQILLFIFMKPVQKYHHFYLQFFFSNTIVFFVTLILIRLFIYLFYKGFCGSSGLYHQW